MSASVVAIFEKAARLVPMKDEQRQQLVLSLDRIEAEIRRLRHLLDASSRCANSGDAVLLEEVVEKVRSRRCLQCGVAVAPDAQYRRGLCSRCYQATRDRIRSGHVTESELVMQGLMADRWATPPGGGRKYTALDEYLATKGRRSGADAEALADQLVEDAEELQAVDSAKKAPRKKGRRRGKAAQKGE